MAKQANILLIYTGGTIGMVRDTKTGALKAFNFDNLLKQIPELNLLNCTISSVALEDPIDSSNMCPKYWVQIANLIKDNYEDYTGFVVLHGSDTMSYTASALSFMLENLCKPVVFTGSQLPIGDLRTDAKENLITSIEMASLMQGDEPLIKEVCLYFEYKLYRGNRTTKMNSEHFEAFDSPNYPDLAESGVHLKVSKKHLLKADLCHQLKVRTNFSTDVGILKMFPGISEQLVQAVLNTNNLRGLILETYGAGNATTADWFVKLLIDAIAKGIHIVNVTQCVAGSVNMGHYETSTELKSIGVISGKDITTEAAITKLMYLLSFNFNRKEFKFNYERPLRGEMF